MRTLEEIEELIKKHPPYSFENDPQHEDEEEMLAGEKDFVRKHGFSFADTWGLDHVIACFAAPRLAYLRDNHCGYPGELYAQAKKIADITEVPDVDELADAMWIKTLDEMIEAFCFIIDEEEPILNLPYSEYDKERRKREIMIDKGLAAFATYYQSLWD